MTLKQRIFSVITSIFIVLVIDNFFLHYLFPKKKALYMQEANQEVQASLKAHPPVDDVMTSPPAPPPATAPALENRPAQRLTDFKTAAEACLGGSWSDVSTLAQDLEKTYGVQSKNRDIENFHVKNTEGLEHRIQIVYESPTKKQVRYFEVDKEGLPSPVVLTLEQRQMNADQLVENLKSQGQLVFHQKKERWLLGNGASFIVTFENGVAREFQVFGASKTLSCLEESCQCL